MSALSIGRLYPPGNIPGTHLCYRLSQLQGHSAAGRIMSMKNSSDTIGNQARDLPACSVVSQPTAPLGPPQIPNGVASDRTPASTVADGRLFASNAKQLNFESFLVGNLEIINQTERLSYTAKQLMCQGDYTYCGDFVRGNRHR